MEFRRFGLKRYKGYAQQVDVDLAPLTILVTCPLAEAIRAFGLGLSFRFPRSAAVWRKLFVFSFLPVRKVLGLPFAGGALAPSSDGFSFVFSELSTGSSLLLLVL